LAIFSKNNVVEISSFGGENISKIATLFLGSGMADLPEQ
jgi:hypothetical protein